MEDEPGCKCQRNCWSIVVIILEAGAILRKDKLTTLDLQNVVGFGFFFDSSQLLFFFSENNFYVYTNIVCVCVFVLYEHILYIYICMYTHIHKIVYVHTNMHMLPHMCGKKERLKPRFNTYFKPLWQCKPKPTPRTVAKLHRNVSKSPQELRPLVWWVI